MLENFHKVNLMHLNNCIKVTKNMDIVFNLLGVTGTPKTNMERPGSFMMSNLYCAINMLMAAQITKVKKISLHQYLWSLCTHSTDERRYGLENFSFKP
jgi:hypothetical protein